MSFPANLASVNLPLHILKFGGSVLDDDRGLDLSVSEVERARNRGARVIAVTSAFRGVTESLLEAAGRRFGGKRPPIPEAVAGLLATGESRAAAFLSLALDAAGIENELLDPDRIGLRVRGPLLDAEPCHVDELTIERALASRPVAVVPGFFGRRPSGAVALLGRGGSDLTALFLAERLGAAECRLVKNVDGLYASDPGRASIQDGATATPDHYEAASWEELSRVGGHLVQRKAVEFARRHRLSFDIAAPLSSRGTRIGPVTRRSLSPSAARGEAESRSETSAGVGPRGAKRSPETEWVQFDPAPGDPHSPSATPIYQTATFRIRREDLEAGGSASAYDYSRSGNPTRSVVEGQLARAEHGRFASAFASGMAAIAAAFSLVEAGDLVLASADLYGGTYRYLTAVLARQGVRVELLDTTGESAGELLEAIDRGPRLVFVETPTNPLMRITDLAALARSVHARGGLVAVDNSLLSPYLQNPLDGGADLVVHSGTKFLSGHADVTAGVVVSCDEELAERIRFHQNACGAGLAPFDAFLLGRGMKTLPLRLERQQETAAIVARWLVGHPEVRRVYYAGLDRHPGKDVHDRQARGAGSVVAFETGSLERSLSLVSALELFTMTVSFGSIHSTVSLPARMSHAAIPETVRRRRHFPEDLVRLSIGVEHPDDLLEDLAQSFDCHAARPTKNGPIRSMNSDV